MLLLQAPHWAEDVVYEVGGAALCHGKSCLHHAFCRVKPCWAGFPAAADMHPSPRHLPLQFTISLPPLQAPGRGHGLAGLGNLGNTCFMASSLQCLAHSLPLMQTFLTGAYRGDLNKDNPVGGG